MKIEIKLTFNNIRKNIKRMIFTIISIILCTILIFTTILLISSVRNGITENIETEYNDYHFIIRDLDIDSFNKIKDKRYIDKIYIQEEEDDQLKKLEEPYTFDGINNINVYIKYKNVREVCKYSTDIIETLNLSKEELRYNQDKCEFNQKLLTVYGLIDVYINIDKYNAVARINYSYVIDILIIFILVAFSILFIIILYNSFLITINERKREYAILNSIGGTEGQILKMIFFEGIILGIIGMIIGGMFSIVATNVILNILNNILSDTGYNFRLIVDSKYLILSVCIILINIFESALIPSVKASTTSVMQGIKNNKEIKYKKRVTLLEKILPIEGKIAIKNIRRNRNKYRTITILLVVCMTSYIAISTYINYEKATSEIVNEYDVDAELRFEEPLDYKYILEDYKAKSGDKVEYMEYKITGLFFLVEPESVLITDILVTQYEDNKKSINMGVIGLDDKTYKNYIEKLNASYGDFIIYNNVSEINGDEQLTYTNFQAFKTQDNFKLSIVSEVWYDVVRYEIVDDEDLNGNFILTDELIEGYREIKTMYKHPTIFTNMDTYNKIEEKCEDYASKNKKAVSKFIINNSLNVKVKCGNIIEFSNYIKEIQDINEKKNIEIDAEYYTLENQEKIIYINIVQLILRIIIIAIVVIGSVSAINIINASLCERKQDFKILNSLGATKENINKTLIYECIYMFMKATIISIILSIPILYGIIKYMENIIVLNKLLIPYGSIFIFIMILLLISLSITILSTRAIEE